MRRNSSRARRGSIIGLCVCVFLFVITLAMFGLQLSRILGTEQEQRTAIEAASLAAAQDLSRIAVEDPYFGFVSLSDFPPNGTATATGDNYYVSAQSINTLLATNRLDCIIADWLNNSIMQGYADRDYKLVIDAQQRLATALQQAIQPGGSGLDINGQTIMPYDDAVAAYNRNAVRMTGRSMLVAGSLKLTLGYQNGLVTNMPVPIPGGTVKVSASQQQSGNYMAFVDVPYDNKDYVFGAMNNDTILVDFRQFLTTLPGLPYGFPTIVKCEANQLIQSRDPNGQIRNQQVHAVSCAQPACLIDQRPHPGALAIDFPSGMIPEFQRPGDLLVNSQVSNSPADLVQTCRTGDSPPGALANIQLPLLSGGDNPMFGQVMPVAFYDWIRRGGPHLHIDALVNALNNSFDTKLGSAPQTHFYEAAPDGTVTYTVQPMPANVTTVISQNQYYAVSGFAVHSANGHDYSAYIKDFSYQPGRQQGGDHAGEPLDIANAPVTGASKSNPATTTLTQASLSRRIFRKGPAGGAVRPTYKQMGIAVEIELGG